MNSRMLRSRPTRSTRQIHVSRLYRDEWQTRCSRPVHMCVHERRRRMWEELRLNVLSLIVSVSLTAHGRHGRCSQIRFLCFKESYQRSFKDSAGTVSFSIHCRSGVQMTALSALLLSLWDPLLTRISPTPFSLGWVCKSICKNYWNGFIHILRSNGTFKALA